MHRRLMQHDRAAAHERAGLDDTPFEVSEVTDHAVVTNDRREVRHRVDDGAILN